MSTQSTVVLRSADIHNAKALRTNCHRAVSWGENIPTIQLDVCAAELAMRPKNTAAELATANAKMEQMRNLPADACSAMYVDKNGVPLVAVWADHIVDSTHNAQVRRLLTDRSTTPDNSLSRPFPTAQPNPNLGVVL